jgi:hypothetical protein
MGSQTPSAARRAVFWVTLLLDTKAEAAPADRQRRREENLAMVLGYE